jgi:iron(III) transport system substrate-binding protein
VHGRRLLAVAGSVLTLMIATACGGGGGAAPEADDPNALVVYNAQHEAVTKTWADMFTKQTGINVVIRNGKDFELANQIKQEGDKSPAEVFLTENSPAMAVVEDAGLFADVDPATLEQVPNKYSTSSGKWVGIAARATVFVYNTSKVSEADLPKSLLDLADPEWHGRWGAAPGGADFQAIVSALLELEGEQVTGDWLEDMKAGYKNYSGNNTVLQGVNAGEVDGGIIYHYYWYRDQANTKENSANTKLHYFRGEDPGAFISVSGGGVLRTAKHHDQAQEFLKFITSKAGQESLAESTDLEYPVGSGVAAAPALEPLKDLDAPTVNPSELNGPKVVELMTQAGLI